MFVMRKSSSMSHTRASHTCRPSRRMVTVSAISKISGQVVGDVDDRDVPFPELADVGEELAGLHLGEGGGRLVQDEDLRVDGHRLEDLHHLALGNGKLPHGYARIDLSGAEEGQKLGGLCDAGIPVDEIRAAHGLSTGEDVLRDAEIGNKAQVLVDDADTGLVGVVRGREGDRGPLQEDLPAVGAVDAAEGEHESALARAILPDKGMHRPGLQGEVHLVERLDPGECLGNRARFQNRLCHASGSLQKAARPVRTGRDIAPRLPTSCG